MKKKNLSVINFIYFSINAIAFVLIFGISIYFSYVWSYLTEPYLHPTSLKLENLIRIVGGENNLKYIVDNITILLTSVMVVPLVFLLIFPFKVVNLVEEEISDFKRRYPNDDANFYEEKLTLDFEYQMRYYLKNATKIVLLFSGIILVVNLWKLFNGTLPMQLNSHQEGIFYITMMMIALVAAGLFFLTDYAQKMDDKIYHLDKKGMIKLIIKSL